MSAAVNGTTETEESDSYGPVVRVFQVALVHAYNNATQPAFNLTPNIPWARASHNSVGGMSGICYYLALDMVAMVGRDPVPCVDIDFFFSKTPKPPAIDCLWWS